MRWVASKRLCVRVRIGPERASRKRLSKLHAAVIKNACSREGPVR